MAEHRHAFAFSTAGLSDTGQVRAINEDSYLMDPESGVWLVADGMGGHAAGDFASNQIKSQLETVGRPSSMEDLKARFIQRLEQANTHILEHAAHLGRGTIGSTVAALMIHDKRFTCLWSGDSRVYLLQDRVLHRVSKDHTEVQALIDAGAISPEDALTWSRKNVITRAIGVTEKVEYELREGQVTDGDMFMICSDGLTEYFQDAEIEDVMNNAYDGVEPLAAWFVRTAVERGGKDNVSVVVVACRALPTPEFEVDGLYPELGSGL